MPQNNEQSKLQEFFKNPDEKFDISPSEPIVPQSVQDDVPEGLKNRHIRRLEAKLQAEREAAIAREARLQALSEAQKFREEAGSDEYDAMVARIFGTDTPEKAAATELLQKALKGYSERAISALREEFQQHQAEETREAETVNSYIEQIEDNYGVDLTSTVAGRQRQEQFRDLWFRLSPKDKDGEIVEYADPDEVWNIFTQQSGSSQARQLASRSMQRSTPVEGGESEDPTVKYLKEKGILDPW
ncbi:MAG: hypothetical protein KGJ90_02160 [Patescibacteria group bacterium]|nr:hypothetical protein [Patescibacteria group bacterium]